jgi:hypothetical protein
MRNGLRSRLTSSEGWRWWRVAGEGFGAMAMAARLGPALAHAQSSKLVALQGSRAGKGGLELAPNGSQAGPVRSRRSAGVRAVNESTIRAAKKAAPPIMPAVLTPSGPVDLSTLMLRNRIIFVGSPVNSEVHEFGFSFGECVRVEGCGDVENR